MKTNKNIALYALAALIVAGFFAVLIVFIVKPVPDVNRRVLDMVVGALIAAFSMVVSYFFGSSKGSADKNEIIKESQK